MSDRQMQEVCMMIEELAKVVRGFEWQLTELKTLNDSTSLSLKNESVATKDLERNLTSQI